MRTVLPTHTPIDADELMAIIILENLTCQPFYKSERPDIYSEDKKIGVEVTRAYLPEYERYNGKLISDELKGIVRTTPQVVSFSASVSKEMVRMQERIVDKMQKLSGYTKYPLNYLYIKTLIWSYYCELHTLPAMFDSLKKQIIEQCNKNNKEYKCFDVLLVECADMFLIWDWNNDNIMFRPDLYEEYKSQCHNAFYLISQELDTSVSAVDNTPFKSISKLFSENTERNGD